MTMALAACASVDGGAKSTVMLQLEGLNTGSVQTIPAVANLAGQPAVLYANADNRIVFQRGVQKQLLDEGAPVKGGNRFQLNKAGDRLYAQWWSHEGNKSLYFTSMQDEGKSFEPISIVNDANGILSPINFLHNSDGTIGMTYHDERSPRFQAYFNRSVDHGRTWGRPDQRLDVPPPNGDSSLVKEPQSAESQNTWVVAWVDSVTIVGKTTNRILVTKSDDAGQHWSLPQTLFESEQYIASLAIKAAGPIVVVVADENERGILAFVSNNNGGNWQSAGILSGTTAQPGAEGSSNSGIKMVLSEGYAHLVWMTANKSMKARIMRGRVNLADARWQGNAERLDVKQYDNTQSTIPTLLATKSGTLLAAWVDYRDIKPNIYVSSSFNKGQNWTAPKPIEQPGRISLGLPTLLQWGEDAAIGYQSYPDDRVLAGNFILRLLPVTASSVVMPNFLAQASMSDNERKELLITRVKNFWQSRMSDDYKASYSMFDFAYRAQMSEKNYIGSTGVMTYLAFEQPEVVVNGNEATVTTKVRYEVQPTTLPSGKTIKLEPTDAETVSTWVWVKDNWYVVFKPSPGEPSLKY